MLLCPPIGINEILSQKGNDAVKPQKYKNHPVPDVANACNPAAADAAADHVAAAGAADNVAAAAGNAAAAAAAADNAAAAVADNAAAADTAIATAAATPAAAVVDGLCYTEEQELGFRV